LGMFVIDMRHDITLFARFGWNHGPVFGGK